MEFDRETETVASVPAEIARILVVEDELIFAKAVVRRLTRAGYACQAAASLADAQGMLKEQAPDLLLLDMRLPDGSGLEFLERLRTEIAVTAPVIVMTAYGEVDDAVSAMKLSASDYLKKPVDLDELLLTVQKVLANQRLSTQLEYSRAREARGGDTLALIGDSRPMRRLREQIKKIAHLGGVSDMPPPTVLITGETGTGKDITARLLHQGSARRDKPFVHVDCASLPKDLIEAELFGHVKGAFTNAHVERTGLIEMAEDGVVFLDEIGELPLELQAKLLAVLERRMLRRVGSSREHPIEAWFIAATNRDADEMVANGSLRSDLYFRLNVLDLELSPLRQRGEDVLLLSENFGAQVARRYGVGAFRLSQSARRCLLSYSWPGNVRELRHLIERATLLSGDGNVTDEGLMLPATNTSEPALSADFSALTLDEAEKLLIRGALERCDNNVSAAARQLGVTRMAMRYRMKKHGFD